MSKELQTYKTIIFGDYAAQKNGNNVLVTKRDGTQQIMEMQEFRKFFIANTPKIQNQPQKDTFNFSQAFDAFPINESDSVGTRIGKQFANIGRLHVINKNDSAIDKVNKGLHNFYSSALNPLAAVALHAETLKNINNPADNKYSPWKK